MADKKYFNQKTASAVTASITDAGYLEICQPDDHEDVAFFLTPSQAVRLARYIQGNLKEQRSNWGDGDSGDK